MLFTAPQRPGRARLLLPFVLATIAGLHPALATPPENPAPGPVRSYAPDPVLSAQVRAADLARPRAEIVEEELRGDGIRPDHPPIDQIPWMPMPGAVPKDMPRLIPSVDTVTLCDLERGIVRELPLGDASDPQAAHIGGTYYPGYDTRSAPVEMARGLGFMTAVPAAQLDTWPTRGNCKLVMRYVDVNGNNQYFVCSGSMQDAGVVLTAAHCVYGRAGTNGAADIYDFAQEIWVYPGWDGVGANGNSPTSQEILQHWGWARGTQFLAGTGWVNDGDMDRDCAVIGIDRTVSRNVGMLTGWFAWGFNNCDENRSYYNASYPAESCSMTLHTGRQMYFWSGTVDACPGVADNFYTVYTTPGCFTAGWGGMSGSGMYYFDSNNVRRMSAVCSNGDRANIQNYCQMWSQFATDMENFKAGIRGNTFDAEALQYRIAGSGGASVDVRQNGIIPAGTVVVSNPTNANPGPRTITLRVRLSPDANINGLDLECGTFSFPNVDFGAMTSVSLNIPSMPLPVNVFTGNYFLGVELDSSTDGNSSNNETDSWDAQPVTVVACPAATALTPSVTNFLCDRIRLSWSTNSGASSYRIYRAGTNNYNQAVLLGTSTTNIYDDYTAPADGSSQYYWVRFDLDCGTSPATSPGVGNRVPSATAPGNVSATDGSQCGQVTVSWTASQHASSYQVYRNSVNNTATATLLGGTDGLTYVDSNVGSGINYYFVKALDNCDGTFGGPDTGFKAIVPLPPANVTASDGTECERVLVTWTFVGNSDSYRLYRGVTNNPLAASLIASPTTNFYYDMNVNPGVTYYYWVRSYNSCGPGNLSAGDSGYRAVALPAPSGVSAGDSTSCVTVSVAWSPVPGAASYTVWRATSDDEALASQIGATSLTAYSDAAAVAGTEYYYFVKAANDCGSGPFSLSDAGRRNRMPSVPSAVSASDGTACHSVTITWTGDPDATQYQVYRGASSNAASAVGIGSTARPYYTDNAAAPGTTYFYFVKAINACGQSAFSRGEMGTSGDTVTFTQQPQDITRAEGTSAEFSVLVGGATSYIWKRNGVALANGGNISGANTDTLTINPVSLSDEADYSVSVTSPCGHPTSRAAHLTVQRPMCPADFNQDGGIDGADVQAFFGAWEGGDAAADVNLDGGIDGADVEFFFAAWENGGC